MKTAGSRVRPRRLLPRVRLAGLARKLVGALGYDLLRKHYYSPIPDMDRLPAHTWTRESGLSGIDFDVAGGLRFLQEELAGFIQEYAPPRGPTGDPRDYYMNNSFYGAVDGITLYGMVRRFAPRRVIELGSGMSTLVIADARRQNDADEGDFHKVYDPYPRPELIDAISESALLKSVAATDVRLDEFAELSANDILFVDTTHTVKTGSDVNYVILDVLPRLAPGVVIHFHDIFLPWDYPREFLERRFFWAEQYLLQAFLAFNREYEVLFSAHAVTREHHDPMAELVPDVDLGARPGALWLRRIDAATSPQSRK